MLDNKATFYKLDAVLLEEDSFSNQILAFRKEYGNSEHFKQQICVNLICPFLIAVGEQSYFKDAILEAWDDFALDKLEIEITGLEAQNFLGNIVINALLELDSSLMHALEAIESVFNQHRLSKEIKVEKNPYKIEIAKIAKEEFSQAIIDRASQFFAVSSIVQLSSLELRKKLNNHGWQNSISLLIQL